MNWSISQKILFRFFSIYFTLFCLSNQFFTAGILDLIWHKLIPWFAKHILQLPTDITVFTNGSGDTTFNVVSLLVYAILALIGTIIWSVIDQKRSGYDRALQWFLVLIRYYLIYQMVIYGLAKVFYLQFQPPHFAKLVQAYGDSSPMGLLWTFMGFSKGYTVFTGLGELAGGLLLLHRKTTTLGALIIFGVMANVMALNYFYDVPVKILSTHLVLMSLLLILLDFRRLWNVLIVNKPAEAANLRPLFSPKSEQVKDIVKWVLVGIGAIVVVVYMTRMLNKWGPNATKPILHGLYEVTTFEKNGAEVPPLTTDSTRWRRLIIDWKNRASIQVMTDQLLPYNFEPDTTQQTISLFAGRDSSLMDTLHYHFIDSTHLQLEGIMRGDTIKILMKTKRKEDFPLMNRGFHWISEYPFNR